MVSPSVSGSGTLLVTMTRTEDSLMAGENPTQFVPFYSFSTCRFCIANITSVVDCTCFLDRVLNAQIFLNTTIFVGRSQWTFLETIRGRCTSEKSSSRPQNIFVTRFDVVFRADVILCCFSAVRPRSLRSVKNHWIPEIQRSTVVRFRFL